VLLESKNFCAKWRASFVVSSRHSFCVVLCRGCASALEPLVVAIQVVVELKSHFNRASDLFKKARFPRSKCFGRVWSCEAAPWDRCTSSLEGTLSRVCVRAQTVHTRVCACVRGCMHVAPLCQVSQGRGGGYLWVNAVPGPRGVGTALGPGVAERAAVCALSLWLAGQLDQQQRGGGGGGGGGIAPLGLAAGCACRPVGGGVATAEAASGLFGFAPVAHADECRPDLAPGEVCG